MEKKPTSFEYLALAVENILAAMREGAPTGNRARDAVELVRLSRAAREAETKQ